MKKFSFLIDSEVFGKNFRAEFSLSESFIDGMVGKIKAAKELGIWHASFLDHESKNNFLSGAAQLDLYPAEKFPMTCVLSFQGRVGEDGESQENYYFDLFLDEENSISIRPAVY